MSSTVQRGSKSGGRQSLFYRDLASPISAQRGGGGRFATPGQAAAVSALWRENFGAAAADPPPPPAFTLDDRADFSPEPGLAEAPPASPTESRTPMSASPLKSGSGGTPNGGMNVAQQQVQQTPPSSATWWSPVTRRSGGSGGIARDDKGKGSPVDGVVQPGVLIVLPPPREVARPEVQRNSLPVGGLDEEEWVTVYGFSPGDTNLVLREFEKCGSILKHVPGPRNANWMHILYENRYDAQKALRKDGMQINSVLIVGVKPVDPAQRQFLNERLNSNGHGGFMTSMPPKSSSGWSAAAVNSVGASHRPNFLTTGASTANAENGRSRSTGAIASPAKSVVSKVMDLMFGI